MPATNSIDTETFLGFLGEPPSYQERIERLEYEGSDGARYRKLGKSSGVFQLVSIVDVADIAGGRTKLAAYAAMVGTAEVDLVWRGYNFTTENLKVVVIAVQQESLRSVIQWAGAANPANHAELRARWTLEFRKV